MAVLYNKITRTSEYKRISKGCKKIYSKNFIILYNFIHSDIPSFGITVSGKVGIAVRRNYCKRIIRNILRETSSIFSFRYIECILIARPSLVGTPYNQIKEELSKVFSSLQEATPLGDIQS